MAALLLMETYISVLDQVVQKKLILQEKEKFSELFGMILLSSARVMKQKLVE
jgi:hypothetical protein